MVVISEARKNIQRRKNEIKFKKIKKMIVNLKQKGGILQD